MKKTGFVFDMQYLRHKTFNGHPECSQRLEVMLRGIKAAGLQEHLLPIVPKPANQRWLEAVHNIRYIMRFEEACIMGLPDIDHQDNSICRDTYDAALLAAGGVMDAIDKVMEGEAKNAFCAARPPGHHAEVDKAMGFCYFNNVAVGARYLQRHWEIERIGIIDFDVHHGNGTQHIFEHDNSVFYYSIHEHPSFAYPGTGREFETGMAEGDGYTLNSPILPGGGDREYRDKLTNDLIPAFREFKPQFLLVSAGFDAHASDLMSGINLTTEGYDFISDVVVDLAHEHAGGRLVSVLEGGYNLDVLPILIVNHLEKLIGA